MQTGTARGGEQVIVAVEHPDGERGTCSLIDGIELWDEFTSRPVDRVLDVPSPRGAPDVLWLVGGLAAVHVDGVRYNVRPRALLCASGRHQLWVCGPTRGLARVPGGELDAVEYVSDKWTGELVQYVHDFDPPRPRLVRGRGEWRISGGSFELTSDGIEG